MRLYASLCGGGSRTTKLANPIVFQLATPVDYRHPPPKLGQDTDSVLLTLGYDAQDIARLRSAGSCNLCSYNNQEMLL